MKRWLLALVRVLHAWAGATLSLVLLTLGLTGALLAFKTDWIRLTVPQARITADTSPQALGAAADKLEAMHGSHLHHVVFADGALGVHRLFMHDNMYAYVDAKGAMIAQWVGTGRLEEFVYELHHFLLAGDSGMRIAGLCAFAACLLALTGLVVWAPVWRASRLRLWPKSMRRGDVLAAHRNIGLIFALPIILFCLTGGAMIFDGTTQKLLVRAFPGPEPETFFPPVDPGDIDWPTALAAAQARFPNAEIRGAIWPQFPAAPVEVRMRQPQEWTPDGGTKVFIDPATSQVVGAIDAQAIGRGLRLESALLPLHGAFVGGRLFDLLAALSGLALASLGGIGLWSFLIKPLRFKPRGQTAAGP